MPRNKKGCLEEINKIAFNMEKWMGMDGNAKKAIIIRGRGWKNSFDIMLMNFWLPLLGLK